MSEASGAKSAPLTLNFRSPLPYLWPAFSPSDTLGVGSNGDDPVTAVRGAEGGSGNTVPRHVKPERGQVPENGSPDGSVMESEDVRHVLDDDVAGSKLANDSSELGPESSLRMSEASPLPRRRGPLHGKPPAMHSTRSRLWAPTVRTSS
jgi:hypothetical protein